MVEYGLTYAVVTKTTVRRTGWPEHLACEAIFEFDNLPIYKNLLGPRWGPVCACPRVI